MSPKRWSLLFILLFTFQIFLPCEGLAAKLGDVVNALEQGYSILNDVRADFSQQTEIASMGRKERGAGELFLKKGKGNQAMFRFNYSKPKQQFISNGKKLWYYMPENSQVIVSDVASLFENGNSVALNYLTGMGHVSKDFNIRFAGDGHDKKGNYLLELIPKNPTQAMAKLHLAIKSQAVDSFVKEGQAANPFPIAYSVLFDSLGNRTTIEFSNVKVNKGIAGDIFNFKIPKGVEVVNQGRK